jgi:hypothetical protein
MLQQYCPQVYLNNLKRVDWHHQNRIHHRAAFAAAAVPRLAARQASHSNPLQSHAKLN